MIIAEIGQNWNGIIRLAKEMIISAKENGADLAKFQLYDSKRLYGEKQNTELIKSQAKELFEWGEKHGIEVFFSVFDVERFRWCEEIGVKRYKVASRSNTDKVLARRLIASRKPLIISMNSPLYSHSIWRKVSYKILYCISNYPTRLSELHFETIKFGSWFAGFSDHTIGIDAAKIAISRGAKIIEKHFTFDKSFEGPDHFHSMIPEELKELRRFYDTVQEAL